MEMNRIIKKMINIFIFLLIANFPFVSMVQILGFDIFIDSFENSGSYLFIDDAKKTINYNLSDGQYLIFQKSSHPDFLIKQKDIILYCKENGELTCQTVYSINSIGSINYYTTKNNKDTYDEKPVYKSQIIGKIICVVDDNIVNKISMRVWDSSIHNFNINSFL